MSIEEVIRKAPETANELLRKLAETTDGATKTREKLLAQLSDEIELLVGRKEEQLFPALQKHKQMKKLIEAAAEGHRKIYELLSELEDMEVTDESFSKKVGELRRIFQSEVQNERKELIPAIKKALGGEEAQEIVDKMQRAAEEGVEEMQESAEQTTQAAAEAGKVAAATGRAAMETGESLARSNTRIAASTARRAVEESEAFMAAGTGLMPAMMRNFAEPPATAMREAAFAWLEFMEESTGAIARFGRDMPAALTPLRWASISTRTGTELASAWMNTSSKMWAISTRLYSEQAGQIRREG